MFSNSLMLQTVRIKFWDWAYLERATVNVTLAMVYAFSLVRFNGIVNNIRVHYSNQVMCLIFGSTINSVCHRVGNKISHPQIVDFAVFLGEISTRNIRA